MLAFVHIEKTGGTTLNHILRRAYFMRFAEVRPLFAESHQMVNAREIRTYLKINPKLQGISGHALKVSHSFVGLDGIRWITLLRDPIERYISHYQYFVNNGVRSYSFEEYLNEERFHNFQTKKLSGDGQVSEAITSLQEAFMIGLTAEFEHFVVRLFRKLGADGFTPRYQIQNRTKYDTNQDYSRFHNIIAEVNAQDIALYKAAELIVRKLRDQDDALFDREVTSLREVYSTFRRGYRDYIDYVVRKMYYQPITGNIRVRNGLSYRGAY